MLIPALNRALELVGAEQSDGVFLVVAEQHPETTRGVQEVVAEEGTGPAVATGTWQGFWIYLVGPALGALLGVAAARLVGRGHREIHQARIAPHPADPHVGAPAEAKG